MKKNFFIYLLIGLTAGCQNPVDFDPADYPTKIFPISNSKLKELRSEFDSLNNYQNCWQLDIYGFADASFNCFRLKKLYDSNYSDAEIIQQVKNWLVKNSKFTNVDYISKLKIRRIVDSFRLDFKNQIYKGYPVLRTEIAVWYNGKDVFNAAGHWYKDIFIPPVDIYSVEAAKKSIVETMSEITADLFPSIPASKVIFPVIKDNIIELRIAWKIPVGLNENNLLYNIYVDTTNGEIIWTEPLVIFLTQNSL